MSIDLRGSPDNRDGAAGGDAGANGRAGRIEAAGNGAGPVKGLFGPRSRITIFDIEQAVASGLLDVDLDS